MSGPSAAKDFRASPAKPEAAATSGDSLPDARTIAALLDRTRGFRHSPRYTGFRAQLARLAATPPQVLLLEGGDVAERLEAAHYWMAILNCRAPDSPAGGCAAEREPCLNCPECIRMTVHLHRDCFFLDGTAGSIKIDEVREVRSRLGEPPQEARMRMVIFREAQALGEAAANALLTALENPLPDTSFVFLVPQRERLLPTLVSRSMVLTLPWPLPSSDGSLASWEEALRDFIVNGHGLWERTGTRGAVDASLAHALIGLCRRALAARLAGAPTSGGLEALLASLPPQRLRCLDEALAEAQDCLGFSVNPSLTLEWLATRMYLIFPR
ncbi:MAG: DNA polymerase III subunit delta' [Desulfovibrio sp.]|jgi:DNA polymerase-3 subunit delta'|nr:DNA polymerase III subunit delta' [Desulfovibrio sp.]